MALEIKNFETDSDGLKKIIDFIHGPENIFRNTRADKPTDNMVFCIDKITPVIGHSPSKVYWYHVDLEKLFDGGNEYNDRLFDLMKQVYKK